MKTLFIAILFAFSMGAYSQKIKTVEIWHWNGTQKTLEVNYVYNNNDSVIYTGIRLGGQNNRYRELYDYITVFSGTPRMFFLINEVEKFFKENEPGVQNTIQGCVVTVDKGGLIGGNYNAIYEKDGNGYVSFTLNNLANMKNTFVEWATKNNVKLTF